MALQHLRSSTANKRPTAGSMADAQLALNTNVASPGVFFKDSTGALVKAGPVHVGTTAPNASPAVGGSSGNSIGELWLDTSLTPNQLKTWNGSAWVSDFPDEIPVAKLADGSARQLLQTDAAGTGVEWTSNVDVPGTLDVTSTATFDSIASHPLGTAGAPTITFTGDTNTGIYSPGADQVAISTNGTGRLFVDASGNIGAGSSSPDARLDVTRSGNGLISVLQTDANRGFQFESQSDTQIQLASIQGSTNFDLWANTITFSAGGSERLRITSDGKLGLGTSSPSESLHVNGNARANHFLSQGYFAGQGNLSTADARSGLTGIGPSSASSLSSFYGGYAFFYGATHSTRPGDIELGTGLNTAGTIQFRITDTERMRIDSSGRLLVGTTASKQTNGAKVEIVGTRTSNGVYELALHEDPINPLMTFSRGASLVSADFALGEIGFYGHDGVDKESSAGRIRCEVDGTPGANDMPGRLVFSTTSDSASSPTERLRITSDAYVRLASGTGGIQFNGDTAAANALDDYEEGTHSVAMTGSSGGSVTFSSNTLTYTKVGKLVAINGSATVSSTTMGGSEIVVTLPFTVASTGEFSDCVIWLFDSSASTFVPARVYAATTSAWKVRLAAAAVEASDIFVFNFCYRTA